MIKPSDHLRLLYKTSYLAWRRLRTLHGLRVYSPVELHGAAYIALHAACKNFDEAAGNKPSTYLYPSCFGAARNEMRFLMGFKRHAYHYTFGSINETDASRSMASQTYGLEDGVQHSILDSKPHFDPDTQETLDTAKLALNLLGEPYITIIRKRFWEDQSLQEIGDKFGITRERVRQIERDALSFLKLVLSSTGQRRKVAKPLVGTYQKTMKAILGIDEVNRRRFKAKLELVEKRKREQRTRSAAARTREWKRREAKRSQFKFAARWGVDVQPLTPVEQLKLKLIGSPKEWIA